MIKRSMLVILFALVLSWPALAPGDTERFDVPLSDSPSLGPADAPVTIIEFLDYQ